MNDGRVQDDHDDLEREPSARTSASRSTRLVSRNAHKRHEPRDEAVPGPLEHVEKDGEEGTADGEREEPALEEVGDIQRRRGLVEAMLLLEDERLVDRERSADRGRDHEQNRGEHEGSGNLWPRRQWRRHTTPSVGRTSYSGP